MLSIVAESKRDGRVYRTSPLFVIVLCWASVLRRFARYPSSLAATFTCTQMTDYVDLMMEVFNDSSGKFGRDVFLLKNRNLLINDQPCGNDIGKQCVGLALWIAWEWKAKHSLRCDCLIIDLGAKTGEKRLIMVKWLWQSSASVDLCALLIVFLIIA